MTESQLIAKDGMLQFNNVDKLYLPKNCVACGKTTNNTIEKHLYGTFSSIKHVKKDYHVSLPICEKCESHMKIKKNNELLKLITFSVAGLIGAFLIFFNLFSIFLSITLFIIIFFFTFLHYRKRVGSRVSLSDKLQMQIRSLSSNSSENVLQLNFLNENYGKYVCKLNLEKNTSLKKTDSFKDFRVKPEKKIESKNDIYNEEKIKCIECGEFVNKSLNFCVKCGAKLPKINDIQIKKIETSKSTTPIEIQEIPTDTELKEIKSVNNLTDNNETLTPIEKSKDLPKIICPQCESLIDSTLNFCIKCGANLIKKNESGSIAKDPEEIECPNCKSLMPSDSLFCFKCGAKFNK